MRDTTRVALALVGAWTLNDLEELATMRAGSRDLLARLPEFVPVPAAARERGLSQLHVTTAIGIVGAIMAAISADGVRSQGRSTLFRAGLLGFGLHGVGHVAGSVAARGYTSGVATAPTAVIPMWLWGRRVLRRNGIRDIDARVVAAVPPLLALVPGAHAATHAILGGRSWGPAPEPAGHAAQLTG